MTIAELVCELMYAGKTRKEIAGYDDAFMRWVLCKPRDEAGRLIRYDPGLPRYVTDNIDSDGHWKIKSPKPYSVMLHQVMEMQGLDKQQQKQAWESWKESNPSYGRRTSDG